MLDAQEIQRLYKIIRLLFLGVFYGALLLAGGGMLAFSFMSIAHPEPISSMQEYKRSQHWGVAWLFIAVAWLSGVIWLHLFLRRRRKARGHTTNQARI
jgi:hypothetical protein